MFCSVGLKIAIPALKGRNMLAMGAAHREVTGDSPSVNMVGDSPSGDIAGWQSDITPFQGFKFTVFITGLCPVQIYYALSGLRRHCKLCAF